MSFQIVFLTKWAHFESIFSIENIKKCLEFEQINELISDKLKYTLIKTKSSDRFFRYYSDV